MEHLGVAKSVDITKHSTTIVGGKADYEKVEKHIENLKVQIADEANSIEACTRLQERITRLASGIAIIRVGAATEVEMIEKKHRIEDALEAVRSAQQEGIHSGGGTSLLRASHSVVVDVDNPTQQRGVEIVLAAIRAPVRQISLNAGASPDLVEQKIINSESGKGYCFDTDTVVDYYSLGVIDPLKVTRCALQNAASAAGTLITTNFGIVQKN
jgi:chaperonin GroEL